MSRIVLIVEDAETCFATLEIALLRLDSIAVRLVTAGEALRLLHDPGHGVCALITDLHMPKIDGFELIERIRATNATLPIVVVSGDSDPDTPDRVKKLGANAWFPKPYSPGAVRQTLEELIHVH